MIKRKLFLLFLVFLLLINIVFSVVYYNSQNVFEITNVEIFNENNNYFAKINVESYVPQKLFLNSEIIYKTENLVVNQNNFICEGNNCEVILPIDNIFFGGYRLDLFTKYKGKNYIAKHHFDLNYEDIFLPQVNISLNQNIFLIEESLIKVGGNVYLNQENFDEVKYLFEVYPLSKPDFRQYYEKTCYGSCSFEFDLEGPYVVDNYQLNLYSIYGETFTNFKIALNDSIDEIYYFEDLPLNFVYSNEDIVSYDYNFNLNQENKEIFEISNLDNVDVELIINEGNVKNIFIPKTKLEQTSIGFEYVEKQKVNLDLDIQNAFAINPQFSSNVKSYSVDFIAKGNAVYKCEDYDFDNQNCFGNFFKILDTVVGQNYTLNLTPVDPIFVEIFEPQLNVQRGVTISTGTSISQSIDIINQSQSLISYRMINSGSTPNIWQFTPNFLDDSTLRFDRYDGATTNTQISWEVISSNLFNVQRGEEILSAGSNSLNIPISNVNLDESFVVVYGRCNSGQNGNNIAGFFRANLTSQNNLYVERGNGAVCEAIVNWQVVEFEGSQVQNGEVLFDSTSTSISDNINAVNRLNSFLIFSSSSIGTDPGMNSNLFRGEISASNQVTFTRSGAETNSNRNIFYYVVSHPSLNVQRGYNSFSNSITQTITQIDNLSKTFLVSSVANSGGGQTYSNHHYYLNFLDDSTLNFIKQTTQQTDYVNWEVIEFIPTVIDLTGQVNITSLSGNNYNYDDLICEYSLDGDTIGVLINWYKNSNNILDLYLPFEGSSSNYFRDLSDNELLFSCVNCPVWQSNTGFDSNGVFLFDGIDDYIEASNSVLDLSSSNFTISLWVNSFITDNNYHGIIGYHPGSTAQRYPGIWVYNQNQIHFGFGTGSTWCSSTSGNVLSSGWNHLVLIFNGENLDLYVNGVREVSYNGCSGTSPFAQTSINIGRVDNYFNGLIDDVRIYKTVLSNGQIENLFLNNINTLSNEETDATEMWECKVNGFNDINIGPDYFSNSLYVISNPILELNTTPNTCSQTFGLFCGLWPATSEGDNTFDTCPTSVGGSGDENVREVYINTSEVYFGDLVEVTCEFDPYSSGSEEYIYYYNGSGWRQLYSGNPANGNIHNITVSTVVDSFEGNHWFRCIIDWDGENDECANQGSYYDNDDVKLNVFKKPEIFTLNIVSPENKSYKNSYITSEFNINKIGSLEYSIDGSNYVSACSMCNEFSFSQIYRDGSHNLTIKATEFSTGDILFDSVIFSVLSNSSVEPRNTSMRTCSDTFSLFCGLWPAVNEGDNTFDSCPTSAGGAGDENVIEVYINTTSAYFGDLVEVTCEFDPYSTGSEEYIYYYNGSGWRQLYTGNPLDGNVHNVTLSIILDPFEGNHWFRCIIDWDGENDECANQGSYYDNDDASIQVIDNTIPEIPFVLSILSPLNTVYYSSLINLDFLTSVNSNISYSINGGSFIDVCFNCTNFIGSIDVTSKNNFLEVKAVHFENGSIIYANVSFILDESVDLKPGIDNLNLRSEFMFNQSNENLICDYSLNSLANSSVVNWYFDGLSINILNLPFEGNRTNALLDFSGNNNDAIIGGDVFWNSSLGAFYFDGNNDYLSFGDIDELDNPSKFSISLWFYRQSDVGDITNQGIANVLLSQSSQNNNDNLEIGTVGSSIELYLDTSGTDSFSYDAGIQNERWYHLGITYDTSRTNELELYLDGVLVQSFNEPSGALVSSVAAPLSLGVGRSDRADPRGDFNGFIENVEIFNYAISSNFMNNLANNNSNILPFTETKEGNVWMCSVTAFSSLEKSNTLNSNILQILEASFRGLHLKLNSNITRIDEGEYEVKLNLVNLNEVPTPKNQIIKIFGFISNNSIISNRIFSSSSWYNLIENSEIISGGQIFEWSIISDNLDDSSLDRNTDEINNSNSVLISFEINGTGNYSFSDLMKFGFDPVFE